MKYIFTFTLLALVSCRPASNFPELHEFTIKNDLFSGKIKFQPLRKNPGFKILLQNDIGETTDQTIFRYIPYRFDTADVDQDGRTEIIVGLVKTTRFDPVEKRRLFILRIDDNHIRPLWLGSKVCQELIDFRTLSHGRIQTLERSTTGDFAIGNYHWQSFGLTLEKYTHSKINFNHAEQIFKN